MLILHSENQLDITIMKKKLIYFIAVAVITLFSCGDFLEEESQSEVIPKTTDDFSELLIGNGYPDNNTPNISMLSLLDDDCDANLEYTLTDWTTGSQYDAFAGSVNAVTPFPYYSWQPYMCDFDGFGNEINTTPGSTLYAGFYAKIKGCNAVLDLINDAIGSDNAKKRVIAEALAVRALLYFQLVNIYGEPYNYNKNALGVPLKLDADLDVVGINRATVGDVYEQVIVPDLQRAAQMMDALPILTKNYRINQPAIHTILSRVYLFMERYQDCIDEANKALAQNIRLMNVVSEVDFNNLPTGYRIFDYNNPEVMWVYGATTWYWGYQATTGNEYPTGKCADFRAIWDKENDMRWIQYGLEKSLISKPNTDLCQNIRTAETYLNKMEAEALLGKVAEANKDLNTFCKTRIKNYQDVSLSGDDLVKAIRLERRKEFCFEGFRWFDLRRQGMPEIKHRYREIVGGPELIYTLKAKDPMYTIPLPSSIMNKNEGLVQNECRNGEDRMGVPVYINNKE